MEAPTSFKSRYCRALSRLPEHREQLFRDLDTGNQQTRLFRGLSINTNVLNEKAQGWLDDLKARYVLVHSRWMWDNPQEAEAKFRTAIQGVLYVDGGQECLNNRIGCARIGWARRTEVLRGNLDHSEAGGTRTTEGLKQDVYRRYTPADLSHE